jgi:hypothetical protein
MKTIYLALILFSLLFTTKASAQSDAWGVGLRFGSPTAVTIKRYISTRNALDINIGTGPYAVYDNTYGAYHNNGFSIMVNYLWRKNIKNAPGLQYYYGLGGMVSARSYYYDNHRSYRTSGGVGVTAALGLEYFIPNSPITLFAELNPYVEFLPAPFWINLGAGIGGRFVF